MRMTSSTELLTRKESCCGTTSCLHAPCTRLSRAFLTTWLRCVHVFGWNFDFMFKTLFDVSIERARNIILKFIINLVSAIYFYLSFLLLITQISFCR